MKNLTNKQNQWLHTFMDSYFDTGSIYDLVDNSNASYEFFNKLKKYKGEEYAKDKKDIDYLKNITTQRKEEFMMMQLKNDNNKFILWNKVGPHAWWDFKVKLNS